MTTLYPENTIRVRKSQGLKCGIAKWPRHIDNLASQEALHIAFVESVSATACMLESFHYYVDISPSP